MVKPTNASQAAIAKKKEARKKQRKNRRQRRAGQLAPARARVSGLGNQGLKAEIRAMAAYIIMPRESPALRLPLQGTAANKTALVHFNNRGTSNAKNFASATGQTEEIAMHMWFAVRSPVSPLWELTWVTTARDLYSLSYHPIDVANNAVQFYTGDYSASSPGMPFLPPLGRSANSLTALLYVPTSCNVRFDFSGFGAVGAINVTYRVWYNDREFEAFAINNITLTAGSGSFITTAGLGQVGWWEPGSISYTTGSTSAFANTWVMTPRTPAANIAFMYPKFPTYELSNSTLVYSATRVNAQSLLISNTTSFNNKSGRLLGARLENQGVGYFDFTTLASKVGMVNPSNAYEKSADKGVYTWTIPDEQSMALTDYNVTFEQTVGTQCVFDLQDATYMNVVYYAGGVISTGSSIGNTVQTFSVEHDHSLELYTESQLLNLAVGSCMMSEYEIAVKTAGSVPPFEENPLHLAAARMLITSIFKRLYPYVKPLISTGLQKGHDWLQSQL